MSYRIPLAVILLAVLAIALVATAWLSLHGGESILSAPSGGPAHNWGWS